MLSISEARERILDSVVPLLDEYASLLDALGRVLSRDIVAVRAMPPWDNSAMDGYAVHHSDVERASANSPVSLPVAFEVRAGQFSERPLLSGEVARIFTGAPIPQGTTAVVMQEKVVRSGEMALFSSPVQERMNIRQVGDDAAVGQWILGRGTTVRVPEVALLAAQGNTCVPVVQRPTVAIVSTGDELCEPDQTPGREQVVNSNAWAIMAAVSEAGGIPLYRGIVPDRLDAIQSALQGVLHADVVITIGGVSVGEYDFVKEALESTGVRIDFWKVRMKPGKPLAYGVRGATRFIGLPGNPVSAYVGFELFVRPLIRKLLGSGEPFRPEWDAELVNETRPDVERTLVLPADAKNEGGRWRVRTRSKRGSAQLSGVAGTNALLFLEPSLQALPAGSSVRMMYLAS